MWQPKERRALGAALILSALAAALLHFILSGHAKPQAPAWVQALPGLDACANAASALCALAGLWAVRRGRKSLHRSLMLTALGFSALFLVGYLIFHYYNPETLYGGQGWLKGFYLALLASHVALSLLALPLLLAVVAFAGLGFFERHKAWARWAFPIWIYVSISGVAVFLFLAPYYPKN